MFVPKVQSKKKIKIEEVSCMGKTTQVLANILTIVVLLAMIINISEFVFVKDIKLFSVDSPIIFPFLVLLVLAVLIGINIANELKLRRKDRKIIEENLQMQSRKDVIDQLTIVVLFTVINVVYVLLLQYLHFLLGSFVFMVLGMILLNTNTKSFIRRFTLAGIAGLITVPTLYFVFNGVFQIMLP